MWNLQDAPSPMLITVFAGVGTLCASCGKPADPVDHGDCNAAIECSIAMDPTVGAVNKVAYDADSPCWEDSDSAELCRAGCTLLLQQSAESLVGWDIEECSALGNGDLLTFHTGSYSVQITQVVSDTCLVNDSVIGDQQGDLFLQLALGGVQNAVKATLGTSLDTSDLLDASGCDWRAPNIGTCTQTGALYVPVGDNNARQIIDSSIELSFDDWETFSGTLLFTPSKDYPDKLSGCTTELAITGQWGS